MDNLTPMMKQYMSIKKRHKDAILFFRLGDFYEMFYEDAITASQELEIALTKRDAGDNEKAPMCGVPHHVAETYISKLVDKGYKVAICEQLEDPSVAKGLVNRDVIRIVTPGTITDLNILDEKSNNYLLSIYMDEFGLGLAYVDSSTGEFFTTEHIGSEENLYNFLLEEIGKIHPSEIICNESFMNNKRIIRFIENKVNPYINVYSNKEIKSTNWERKILEHFKVKNLNSLGLKNQIYAIISTGKLIEYLYYTQKDSLEHINQINYYEASKYMILDINTRSNLEIHETIIGREKKGSLIWVLDKTSTAMGGRLLKKWLEQPLIDIDEIVKRQKIVEIFSKNIILMNQVKECLKKIYDLERLIGKISYGNCNGRDLSSLKSSLGVVPELKDILIKSNNESLVEIALGLDSLEDVYSIIDKSIVENPPISVKEGGLIKLGYNDELDELKNAATGGKNWLAKLEQIEKEKTGIRNLKIGFNKKSGYFFEVTKGNLALVPDYFIRKQTLTNSERYYTEELKNIEIKILGAEDRMVELEYIIFQEIREKVKSETFRIQNLSRRLSEIDVLNSFAQVAYNNDYIKPSLNNKGIIHIQDGRHPVVEMTMDDNIFVPNDTYLDNNNNRVQIITGPNMAGKSTYMRQVALITLMAQIGSFVPAKEANIAIVDRIFTRIGASDNLSQGESTFMVEMNEVSNIIKNATKNSLIILDEVGRGTSTYDGLSIAWAILEYIAENIGAKTLFATHYHELTQLEGKIEGINNLNILIKEQGDEIIFLRKIEKGSTNKSYGIEVAKLAGIPKEITNRANEILDEIERNHALKNNGESPNKSMEQISILDYRKDYFIEKINKLDVSRMTPMEAINTLYELTKEAEKIKENE